MVIKDVLKSHFVKTTFKVFLDYVITVFLFCLFIISILMLATPETIRSWLLGYSTVWFLLIMMMVYSRMKQVARKEIVPQYELHPYPLKGFVYGAAAMIPNFIVAVLNTFIRFSDEILHERKLLVVKVVFAPLHGFVELFGDTTVSFYLACLVIPVVAATGYIMGYYGIYPVARLFGKSPKQPVGFRRKSE